MKTANLYRLAIQYSLTLPEKEGRDFLKHVMNESPQSYDGTGWRDFVKQGFEKERPVELKVRDKISAEYYRGGKAMAAAACLELERIFSEELDYIVTRSRND